MSTKAGRNALRTCLLKMDGSRNIDDVLCYKYGNKEHMADFQGKDAGAILNSAELERIHNGVPSVVKCFIHPEIYAGWHSSVGMGSGKYHVEAKELAEFEADTNCDFKEIVTGENAKDRVYLFRKDSGIERFFVDALRIKKEKSE